MNILKRFGLLMVSVVALTTGASAQPKGGAMPATTAKLRFITLDEIPASLRLVIESAPKTFSPIVPGLEKFSPEYSYTGAPKFFIFDQAEGQTSPPKPLAEVTLPTAGGAIVVLLAKAQGGLWRAGVLNYDVQAFPGGSVRLINYSSVAIEAMVNEKRFAVKAGETGGHMIPFPKDKDAVSLKLALAYQQSNGQWTVLNNTTQRFFPRQRLQLIGLNTASGAPRVLQLVDYAPAASPKPAAPGAR